MPMHRRTGLAILAAIVVACCSPIAVCTADAQSDATKKWLTTTCYGIDGAYPEVINKTIPAALKTLRTRIRAARTAGKSAAYISIPLSSLGGGYYPLNVRIADFVKGRVESRFHGEVWALTPTTPDANLGKVDGAIYMYMWTQVLMGEIGNGEDFDLFYTVGPSDMQAFFGAQGDVLPALLSYYDLFRNNEDFKKDVGEGEEGKRRFLAYYLTKASVAFSRGSHDEWNIFRGINGKKRKLSEKTGVGDQIPIFFDGRAVSPVEMEKKVSPGYAQCDFSQMRARAAGYSCFSP